MGEGVGDGVGGGVGEGVGAGVGGGVTAIQRSEEFAPVEFVVVPTFRV